MFVLFLNRHIPLFEMTVSILIKHALPYWCSYIKHTSMLRIVPQYGSIPGSTPSPLYRVSLLFGRSLSNVLTQMSECIPETYVRV